MGGGRRTHVRPHRFSPRGEILQPAGAAVQVGELHRHHEPKVEEFSSDIVQAAGENSGGDHGCRHQKCQTSPCCCQALHCPKYSSSLEADSLGLSNCWPGGARGLEEIKLNKLNKINKLHKLKKLNKLKKLKKLNKPKKLVKLERGFKP